jgi:hypothetical protein
MLGGVPLFCGLYKKGLNPPNRSRDQVGSTGAADPARFEARQIATSTAVRRDLDREHPFREAVSRAWRLSPVLILLARDQNSEALLLSLRDERSRDLAWLAKTTCCSRGNLRIGITRFLRKSL